MKSILVSWLAKKAYKSVAAWLSAGLIGTGTAAAIDPEILQAIPEQWRGYVIAAYGAAVLGARLKTEYQNKKREIPQVGMR